MHYDPVFNEVYWMEQKEKFRNTEGCASCEHRGKKYWGEYLCTKNNVRNKRGFCRKWKLQEVE